MSETERNCRGWIERWETARREPVEIERTKGEPQ